MTGLAETIVPLVPIQIASDPLSAQQIDSILPQGHTISDTRRVIMYARREPDNRMVFGGLGKLDRNNDISGHEWLIRDAERVFPQLVPAMQMTGKGPVIEMMHFLDYLESH